MPKVFVLTIGDELTAVFDQKPSFEVFVKHIVGSDTSELQSPTAKFKKIKLKISLDGFYGDFKKASITKAYKSLLKHKIIHIRYKKWSLEYVLNTMDLEPGK